MSDTLTRPELTGGGGGSDHDPAGTRSRRNWRGRIAAGAAVVTLAGGGVVLAAANGVGPFSRRPVAEAPGEGGGDTDNAPAQTGPQRIETAIKQNDDLRRTLAEFLGGEITDVASEAVPEGSNAAMTTVTTANGSKLYVAADAHEVGDEAGVGRTRQQMEEVMTTDPAAAQVWVFRELGEGAGVWYNVSAGIIVQANGYTGAGTPEETPFFIQAELADVPGDPGALLDPLAGVTSALHGTGVFK